MAVPIDFSKWSIFFVVLFLIIFTFSIATITSIYTFEFNIQDIIYAMIGTTLLSTAMLLNLQVLFNHAIFELYPDDFILGAILMFADVMWVLKG